MPGYQSLRSFGKRGFHTILGVEDATTPQARSRYCDETVPLTFSQNDTAGYKDALLRLAARPDVQTIVPVWEETVFVLSKYRDEFEEYIDLAVPQFDRLRNVHDRMRLIEVAKRAGVPIPETHLLTDINDWDRDLIIKSRYNLLADDYMDSYPANRTDAPDLIKHVRPGERPGVERLICEMDHVPIVQEFVRWKDEYMVGAICDHGEPLAMTQLQQIREDSYTGGGGVYRRSIYDPELDSVVRDLLAELNWHGLACVEYMEDDETGKFNLTEINPRIWQSIGPAVRAGVDFPYYYWLLATGQSDLIDPSYEIDVGSHLLKGELEHLQSIRKDDSPYVERPNFYATVGELVRSCIKEPRFDLLRLDDPQPFVRGALSGLQDRIPLTRDD